MNKNIEVEGGELALRNKAGDIVIIPKRYKIEVEGMIKDNCHSCIDKLVETLPVMSDYAEDGTLIKNTSNDPSEFYRLYSNAKGLGNMAKPAVFKSGWVTNYNNGASEFTESDDRNNPPAINNKIKDVSYNEEYEESPVRDGYKYKVTSDNKYYPDVSKDYPEVPIEGDNHWNVAKFAFAPNYLPSSVAPHNYNSATINDGYMEGYATSNPRDFNALSKRSDDDIKETVVNDLKKYYGEGNEYKADSLFNADIQPMVDSDYYKYKKAGVNLGRVDENRGKGVDWFKNVDEYNKNNNIVSNDSTMISGLSNYNKVFRRLPEEEALKISTDLYNEYKNNLNKQ